MYRLARYSCVHFPIAHSDIFPTESQLSDRAQRLLVAVYLPVTVALPLSGVGLVLRNRSLASALSELPVFEVELLLRPRSVDARKDGLPGSSNRPIAGTGTGGAAAAVPCFCASALDERTGSVGRDEATAGPAAGAGAPNIDRLLMRDATELLRELSVCPVPALPLPRVEVDGLS